MVVFVSSCPVAIVTAMNFLSLKRYNSKRADGIILVS